MSLDKIPTFCINLDTRPDRWERIQKRFQTYGLNVNRWKAVTVEDLDGDYSGIGPKHKACAESHLNLYKHALEKGYPMIFVLEDDAAFRKDWKNIAENFLLKLDIIDPKWDSIFFNIAEELSPCETWQTVTWQCLTGGYIIKREAMEFILNFYKESNIYHAIDWATQILQHRGHTYSYFPWLIIQEGSYSDLQQKIPDHDFGKVKRLLKEANYPLENYDIEV